MEKRVNINCYHDEKLSSAKTYVCYNFQPRLVGFKAGNIVLVSNSLDPGQSPIQADVVALW